MSYVCYGVGCPCGSAFWSICLWIDIVRHCNGMIEGMMHVSCSYWSFCHVEVNVVILTCQSGPLTYVCDGKSVTHLCSCDYGLSVIYHSDEVFLMGKCCLGSSW